MLSTVLELHVLHVGMQSSRAVFCWDFSESSPIRSPFSYWWIIPCDDCMHIGCVWAIRSVNHVQSFPTSLCGVAALSLMHRSHRQLWWINLLVDKLCPTVHVLPKPRNWEIRRQTSFKLHMGKDQYCQCCFEVIHVYLHINLIRAKEGLMIKCDTVSSEQRTCRGILA